MLLTLTRKLCPLVSLAIATIGCGKKIAEAQPAALVQTENQVWPSTYPLSLNGTSKKQYKLPRSAQFEIPDRLRVHSGNIQNKTIEIVYDVNEFDSEDFQFKCSYVPSSTTADFVLQSCTDWDGGDFGDVSSQRFTLYQNDTIELRLSGGSATGIVVEAIYRMKWI